MGFVTSVLFLHAPPPPASRIILADGEGKKILHLNFSVHWAQPNVSNKMNNFKRIAPEIMINPEIEMGRARKGITLRPRESFKIYFS